MVPELARGLTGAHAVLPGSPRNADYQTYSSASVALGMIYTLKNKSGEANGIYRNLSTKVGMNPDTLEEVWREYKATKPKTTPILRQPPNLGPPPRSPPDQIVKGTKTATTKTAKAKKQTPKAAGATEPQESAGTGKILRKPA